MERLQFQANFLTNNPPDQLHVSGSIGLLHVVVAMQSAFHLKKLLYNY